MKPTANFRDAISDALASHVWCGDEYCENNGPMWRLNECEDCKRAIWDAAVDVEAALARFRQDDQYGVTYRAPHPQQGVTYPVAYKRDAIALGADEESPAVAMYRRVYATDWEPLP